MKTYIYNLYKNIKTIPAIDPKQCGGSGWIMQYNVAGGDDGDDDDDDHDDHDG